MNKQRISNVLNWCMDNAPEDISLQAEELKDDFSIEIDHTEEEVGKSLGINGTRRDEVWNEWEKMEEKISRPSQAFEEIINNNNINLRETILLSIFIGRLIEQENTELREAHQNIKDLLAKIKESLREKSR